ncbi:MULTISPECIES: MarR family transcriptional regulator [Clostridium]|uniref:MarR family transcriptional regulator n=1 Tax=Clostridium senegalense TaxID=1465809 RepID=A0A6M0H883_9CLOT|nr:MULTISPECIES: MarR family transcriptional regulator [Clostridium]NEU05792.1 MarR family transcriptional regulator [Clostridium senegalense]
MNNNKNLKLIAKDFLTIVPLFQKKLVKRNCNFSQDNLNHSHFQVMATLKFYGKQPISEVSKRLFISMPNMTKLLNKLIEKEMVVRLPDDKDRRIINIELTPKGEKYLDEKYNEVLDTLTSKFSTLSEDQIDKLALSIHNLKEVLTAISSED